MPYAMKEPDRESLLAEDKPRAWRLYATLADCPLYLQVRLFAPDLIGKRVSFWLGWKIEDSCWANNSDKFKLPLEVLDWAAPYLRDLYPDLAAVGLSDDEAAEIKAEQAEKRKKYVRKPRTESIT